MIIVRVCKLLHYVRETKNRVCCVHPIFLPYYVADDVKRSKNNATNTAVFTKRLIM